MQYLWKGVLLLGVLGIYPNAMRAQTQQFAAFGVLIALEEEVFSTERSSDHKVYYSHNSGRYSERFFVGILTKENKAEMVEDLRATQQSHKSFAPEGNGAFAALATESYYGEKGRGKNKDLIGHLFIEIDAYHYLHFYVNRSVANFDAAMDLLNSVLAQVQVNQPTAQGQLATNAIKGFNFKVMNIEGAQYSRGRMGTDVMLRQGRNGEILMLWPDANEEHHMTVLSPDGEVLKDYNFKTSEVYDVVAHDDAFVLLISHPNRLDGKLRHFHLYMEKYDWSQKPIWSTHLMGVDDIKKVGDQRFAYWGSSSTRLAWSGEYYAAHFASYRKWPDLVTHQGDVFLTLTPDGKIMKDMEDYYAYNSTWDVSHSFAQEMVFDGEKFYRMALGDAYPRAIALERSYPQKQSSQVVYNSKSGDFLEFPGKDGDNYVYDTEFSPPLVNYNGQILFMYGTELRVGGKRTATFGKSSCNDLFLKALDTTCKVSKSYRITNTASWEEKNMSMARIDSHRILVKYQRIDPMPKGVKKPAWYSGDIQEVLMVYDLKKKSKESKAVLKSQFHGKAEGTFSISSERKPYSFDAGSYGEQLACSQLYTHSDGRIFMVKFLLEGPGFQLIEIQM